MGSFDPRATTQAERGRDEVTRRSALLFSDSMHTTTHLPATADRSFYKVSRD